MDNKPIQVLIPIPENFIQKQGELEVLSDQKNKEDNLCPENVDLLNISNAYSILVPSFNNLEIENSEMFIQSTKPILSTEQYSLYCQGEKKELKIENYNLDINTTGKMWSGPLKPIRTNKLGIDEEEVIDWNNLVKKENVEKFEVEKNIKYYRFKKIELGDNEVILLKATKRVLKNLTQTEESTITMGGKGFKQRIWEPVPFLANSMTIEKSILSKKLEITSEKMEVSRDRKRRADWNLVNTTSLASSVNLLKEAKEEEETNKWKDIVKKHSGIKLSFGKSVKKFILTVCKEINMFFEREVDDVIVNDDYNNIAGPQTRPIIVTVLKVNEEEETSSVTSYDVFKNLIIQKSNYNISFGANSSNYNNGNLKINLIGNKSNKIGGTFFKSEFSDFAKQQGGIKLRMEENNLKSKYDQTVINLANQTKNILTGNVIKV